MYIGQIYYTWPIARYINWPTWVRFIYMAVFINVGHTKCGSFAKRGVIKISLAYLSVSGCGH